MYFLLSLSSAAIIFILLVFAIKQFADNWHLADMDEEA